MALPDLLRSVASAVSATQQQLDNAGLRPRPNASFAPLAFVARRTQLSLLGNLSVAVAPRSGAVSLVFTQVDRVQAALRGEHGSNVCSRVTVSVDANEACPSG